MYNLIKGKTLLGTFPTYEKARAFARALIRGTAGTKNKTARQMYNSKKIKVASRERPGEFFFVPSVWDGISRNPPSIKLMGYRIVRRDA